MRIVPDTSVIVDGRITGIIKEIKEKSKIEDRREKGQAGTNRWTFRKRKDDLCRPREGFFPEGCFEC